MTYEMSLLAHHSRIAFLSSRQSMIKALHSLAPLILTQSAKVGGKVSVQHKCFVSQLNQEFTGLPASYIRDMEINKEILSKPTVQEQLEFYQSWKDQASVTNRITVLHYIAKIVQKQRGERHVLQRERETFMNGQNSAYIEILDFISDNILSCKTQGLANVMWSLGKLREQDHRLVKVCEKEILLYDFGVFYKAEICQIVNGCTELKLKDSRVFKRVEEAILNGTIKLSRCEKRQVVGILTSFVKMGHGSKEFLEVFEADIAQRNFRLFHNGELTQILRAFAIKGIFSDLLFNKAEDEILRRTPFKLLRTELVAILRSFATAGKGSEELFAAFDEEIVTRRVKNYYSTPLCWIIWAFATRGMTRSKVFRAVAQEIYQRGLNNLENGELSLCLYSYVLSEIPCRAFLKKLETELMSRDLKKFKITQLCQGVWSCARAELLNPNLLQDMEGEILQQNSTQNKESVTVESFLNAEMGSKEQFFYLQKMCALST